MIESMVDAGVSFRRQATVLKMSHQTIHARYTRNENCSPHIRTVKTDPTLLEWIKELKAIHPT